MLHNSCNTTHALPDMSALTLGHYAYIYISGIALLPVLQLLNVKAIWTVGQLMK